ncbi:glutaredoxin 3 [Aureimonas fodinaquatilis]|uniref:Glutaredoxin n=1 Tax=Aureimonas fodinaquatilis TaxID=2565783 RepID=A0A5B0E2F2_9HYPH|nr:glutaredoxin 3 [Aureimonas fodinaquatilis]KAA0971619.1 glutaredoxin 3 [Aureimonas fodinaquatilis]
MAKNIIIYTRDGCGFCSRAKALLNSKDVAYDEKNASEQPEFRAEMLSRANGRSTFPQIFIGATHVGGCDDLYALEHAGKLDALLAAQEA